MTNYILTAALVLSCTSLVFAQQSSKGAIQEVKQKTSTIVAPKQCLDTFREFFRYLQKSEPSTAFGNSTISTPSAVSLRAQRA